MPLQPGDPAPDVPLPDTTNEPVSLASLWREQPAVVLFFPLAFTDTCTAELCAMRDDLPSYAGMNGQVVAISVDSPFVLARFREEIGADYPFLSDFNREATRAFGVLRETPVGPGLLGVSMRAAFVVDTQGRVAYAWASVTPGLLPPFDEIKDALRGLQSAAA